MFYLVEVNPVPPAQYRITVVEAAISYVEDTGGFHRIGTFTSIEQCMEVLQRHLELENSRQ